MKPIPIIVSVIIVALIAFFFLTRPPTESLTDSLDNANIDDRCAKFKQTVDPETGEDYSLGYVGRIRQTLSGCL